MIESVALPKKFFKIAFRRSPKVRWVYQFLRLTEFLSSRELRDLVEEKLARIDARRGPLTEETITALVEDLITAKLMRRYLDRRIKVFVPKVNRDSPTCRFVRGFPKLGFSYQDSACSIFKEQSFHLKRYPSILIPGFVPDGNEAFFLLRKCFLRKGSLYYLNYPTYHFYKETIFHQLYDTITHINDRKLKSAGQKSLPFLIATSFGCWMIVRFLKWARSRDLLRNLKIQGLILISPVLCLEDVIDPEATRQKTLIGRAVSHLVSVNEKNGAEVDRAMKKARSIFQKMFAAGRDSLDIRGNLTPVFAIEDEVLSVFNHDQAVSRGFFRRFAQLREEKPLDVEFLVDTPTLVLFSEGELDALTPNSPTYTTFSDVAKLHRIFPNATLEFVHSRDAKRKVTHSDLIFQAKRYLDHLEPWLGRAIL